MDKKLKLTYKTNLPVQHKYYPKLHGLSGTISDIYSHPNKPNKLMLKFPNPEDPTKDAYLSIKYIDILTASYSNIQFFTFKQIMDIIVDGGHKLPLRLFTINPFREDAFQVVTLMYVSDKDDKVLILSKDKQTMKPIDHIRQNIFCIPSKLEDQDEHQ